MPKNKNKKNTIILQKNVRDSDIVTNKGVGQEIAGNERPWKGAMKNIQDEYNKISGTKSKDQEARTNMVKVRKRDKALCLNNFDSHILLTLSIIAFTM